MPKLWRKSDWALDLLKLGKASKTSSDHWRSLKTVTSLRKSWEVFGWSLEIFGSVRAIFRSTQVIFGNLQRCSGDIRKSLEVFGDLHKSSGMCRWSSEIFGRFRVAFDNLWKVNILISLADTNCPIFSQIGQFLRFYSKSLLKSVQIKSQIGQCSEIKG